MNIPSGSVIRCLLWSWVMGLKKASVEFAVCRLTLSSSSEKAVKQELVDWCEVLLAPLFHFYIFYIYNYFPYLKRRTWQEIRNLCQKGLKVRTERTLLAEPQEETCLCAICQSPSCFINYLKSRGVRLISSECHWLESRALQWGHKIKHKH